jgi:hypothetical protein
VSIYPRKTVSYPTVQKRIYAFCRVKHKGLGDDVSRETKPNNSNAAKKAIRIPWRSGACITFDQRPEDIFVAICEFTA